MIIVEERLTELFSILPMVEDNTGSQYKPNFDYGSEEDCVRFLNSYRKMEGQNTYPLVWLQTPVKVVGEEPRLKVPLKLILAANTSSGLANSKRLELIFKPMLFPLFKNIEKAFNRSGFTKLINRDREVRLNHFNYGVQDGLKKGASTVHPTTDIWDAITFDCEIEMSDCAQRNIFY